ncbi:MAG: hypothetical protein IPP74_08470 [Alphaproteobacteria bacterium]|nr:hypothetical protein [Alphaproteobacteria bacterium]
MHKMLPDNAEAKPRLEPHHQLVLDYINEHGSITQREYQAISSRSLASRKLDIEKLLGFGLIEAKGTGRGTHYVRSIAKSD